MPNYGDIAQAFLDGRDPEDKKVRALFNKNKVNGRGGPWGGFGEAAHGMSASSGTRRMHFGRRADGTSTLWSYEHYPLAVALKGVVILNADGSVSMTTNQQMRELQERAEPRRYVEGKGWRPDEEARSKIGRKVAYLPFSALREAGIGFHEVTEIEVIDVTPSTIREVVVERVFRASPRCGKCFAPLGDGESHRHEVTVEQHFLGEVLFSYKHYSCDQPRYYVSGLDRNDDPGRRKFYLARLPVSDRRPPRTVDEALARLKPDSVRRQEKSGGPARRQGEFFFTPAPDKVALEIEASVRGKAATAKVRKQVPIASDAAEAQSAQLPLAAIREALPMPEPEKPDHWRPRRDRRWRERAVEESREILHRYGRHVADREVIFRGHVYVRGTVRDREHDPLALGDRWHLVTRNLADGSWSVSKDGPQVD